MAGLTLTEFFEQLDNLGIYVAERREGMTPFELIDGHQSRFDFGIS